jgi:hypothetical protein
MQYIGEKMFKIFVGAFCSAFTFYIIYLLTTGKNSNSIVRKRAYLIQIFLSSCLATVSFVTAAMYLVKFHAFSDQKLVFLSGIASTFSVLSAVATSFEQRNP